MEIYQVMIHHKIHLQRKMAVPMVKMAPEMTVMILKVKMKIKVVNKVQVI